MLVYSLPFVFMVTTLPFVMVIQVTKDIFKETVKEGVTGDIFPV